MKSGIARVSVAVGVVALVSGSLSKSAFGESCAGWTPAPGETCVCSDFGPREVTVCLKMDGVTPEENFHFEIDFDCPGCNTAPDIRLFAGNLDWQVWSVNTTTQEIPEPPGDIGVLDAIENTVYGVTLERPDGMPGAGNVKAIIPTSLRIPM